MTSARCESEKLIKDIFGCDVEVYCITDEASSHESFVDKEESLIPKNIKDARSKQGCSGKSLMVKHMPRCRKEVRTLF